MKRIIIAAGAICALFTAATHAATAQMVGGPCNYDKYPGKAKIIKVVQTVDSKKQRGLAPFEGYEVKYVFTATAPVSDKMIADLMKREWIYYLTKSAYEIYPGEKYIAKYGIKVGKEYPCTMSVIKSGTCTPWGFEFKGLDPKDLFEFTGEKK